jgi:hypothetical protein
MTLGKSERDLRLFTCGQLLTQGLPLLSTNPTKGPGEGALDELYALPIQPRTAAVSGNSYPTRASTRPAKAILVGDLVFSRRMHTLLTQSLVKPDRMK